MRKAMAVVLASFLVASSATATVMVYETFSHPDGDLVGKTPEIGGTWVAHSGSGSSPVQVSSGKAVLAQGSGSREDVNVPTGYTMGSGDKWYAGFDLVNTGGNTNACFAHFMQNASNWSARTFIAPPDAGVTGDYVLGMGTSASNPPSVKSTVGLTYGTTYRVVIAYDYNTKVSELWIDPVSEASPKITLSESYSTAHVAFGLRQGAGNSTQTIDNLIVGTTFAEVVPEPAAALLMLGLGCLMAIRRR